MGSKKSLPEHVIKAMQRDDGYIKVKRLPRGVMRYVVCVSTIDGDKTLCTVSDATVKQLAAEGLIKHVGDGKWVLDEQGKGE